MYAAAVQALIIAVYVIPTPTITTQHAAKIVRARGAVVLYWTVAVYVTVVEAMTVQVNAAVQRAVTIVGCVTPTPTITTQHATRIALVRGAVVQS
jgi:hypothetical protein